MDTSYYYRSYGLNICSDLELPELISCGDVEEDVTVKKDTIDDFPSEAAQRSRFSEVTEELAYYYWEHVGYFKIREGREIIIDPLASADDRLIRLPLLGAVFATLLWQRGSLVLHASAVNIGGRAAVFLGQKGAGKSTMAATLHNRGHAIVSDDILPVIDDGNEIPQAVPGFPRLKLRPEAAEASLGDDPSTLPSLYPKAGKKARSAIEGFQLSPIPIGCIYLLEIDNVRGIEPISPREAFIRIVRHTYGLKSFDDKSMAVSSHFLAYSRLIEQVPVRSLKREPSLEQLPDVAALVERDCSVHA